MLIIKQNTVYEFYLFIENWDFFSSLVLNHAAFFMKKVENMEFSDIPNPFGIEGPPFNKNCYNCSSIITKKQ
jgi:hypothetical protein